MAHGGLDPNAWREIFKTEAANLEEEKKHIWDLEFDDSITPKWPQQGWSVCNWKTSGRFRCDLCRRTWPSNLVTVVFIMRLKNGRGIVKTRLYRQNCKICKNAPMVKPDVDSTNIHSLMESLFVHSTL
ncbi:receptor-transporting protein 3-like [Parambassis ranga]|uniref:Receptor-transporting protein 3-like n=1 Tax=Parambassis ranga TaxID=210632 RepID=A0A6P7IGW4_9TELE|nr:receptor-transporting protein 3-like [Parambassis ranga]